MVSDDKYQENVSNRFGELAKAFDSFHSSGKELCNLARNLLSLAFRDVTFVAGGGLVVPQIGPDAGQELLFQIQRAEQTNPDYLSLLQKHNNSFWKAGNTDSIEHLIKPPSSTEELVAVIYPIASGFDRPIGYFWALIAPQIVQEANSRLEYVSRYFSLSVRAEKATNAIDILSRSTLVTYSTPESMIQALAEDCRQALSTPAVFIWLADHANEELKAVATAMYNKSKIVADMKFGQGIAGKCVVDCKSMRVDDLLDQSELNRLGVREIYNVGVVKEHKWRSALFVPLDIGGQAMGVISTYSTRSRGFSGIDNQILHAFATRLSAVCANLDRIKHLTEMEKRLALEAPAIEAGMLAMENVHDSINLLVEAQDYLTRIVSQGNTSKAVSLAKETRDVLDLVTSAKKGIAVLANKAKFTKIIQAPVLLKSVLDEALKKVASSADEAQVNIHVSCPPNLCLLLDRDKICRVFINLFENSIWFLERDTKNGVKTIEVKTSITPDEDNPERVAIEVTDNGPGIAPHDLKRIFDYLYTSKGDRGMGFGLAIAKRIVHGHDGSIQAKSKWGYSTSITLEFPYKLIT